MLNRAGPKNKAVEHSHNDSKHHIVCAPIRTSIQHNSLCIMYYINLIYMSEGCKIQFSHSKQQEWQNGGRSAQLNIAEVPESAHASAERVSMAGINNG